MNTTERPAADSPVADADLTPAERLHEVAAILARGILRLHPHAHTLPDPSESRPSERVAESSEITLDGVAPSRPDPPRG